MRLQQSKHYRIICLLLLMLACSACRHEPQPTTTPTAEPTVVPDTPTPTPIPPTVTPLPTTTPIPNPCPVQQTLIPPDKQTYAQYPEAVRNYLAQGGNPDDIELVDWEGYLFADLTGDLVPEHIFVFIDIFSR